MLYLVTPRNVVKNLARVESTMVKGSIKQLEEEIPTKRRERKHEAELRRGKELLDLFERLLQVIIRSS